MIDPKEDNVTLEQLKEVRVRRLDGAGKRWKAVPHHQTIEALKEEAKNRGWKLENLRCVLSEKKTEMAASLDVTNLAFPRKGTTHCLGVTNSATQRKRLWLFAGLRLDKPECGVVLWKVSMVARRTIHLDLEEKVRETLDLYEKEVEKFPGQITRLEKQRLSLEEAVRIIKQAGKGPRPLHSDSRVRLVEKIVEAKEGTTKWGLLVQFAVANRKARPLSQMDRAYNFLTENLEE